MDERHRAVSMGQIRPPPFQTRAMQFFRKFNLRGKFAPLKSKDAMASPPMETGLGFPRQTRSMDVLRKPPNLSHAVVGLRMEDSCKPMDTDDSSQGASSSNSPSRLSRHYPPWDTTGHANTSPVVTSPGAVRPATSTGFHSPSVSEAQPRSENAVEPPAPVDATDVEPTDPAKQAENAVEPHAPVDATEVEPLAPVKPAEDIDVAEQRAEPKNSNISPVDEQRLIYPTELDATLRSEDSGVLTPSAQSDAQTVRPSDIQGRRSLGTPLTTTIPPGFQMTADHGLRFSPSILSRYTTMPPRHLPTLLPPTPAVPITAVRPQARLRTMPSLSLHGVTDADVESDHEGSIVGESDDEEGEEDAMVDAESVIGEESDEEGDDMMPGSPSPGSMHSHSRKSSLLPRINTSFNALSRNSVGSPTPLAGPSRLAVLGGDVTPTDPSRVDYFTPKVPSIRTEITSPNFTPRPSDHKSYPYPQFLAMPTSAALRPDLHHVASRSMIDLHSPTKEPGSLEHHESLLKGKSKETIRSTAPSTAANTVASSHAQAGSTAGDDVLGVGRAGTLRRQNSMPSFNPSTAPPPYPIFSLRRSYRVQPRDEEGRERLPGYSNSLYLAAIMPRKMEFTAPGVQAKDRKWRRVLCELDGTTFRVYKCPAGASGAGIIGEWWEKKVGVGDIATGATSNIAPTKKEEPERRIKDPDTPSSSSFFNSAVEQDRRRSQSQSSHTSARRKRSSFLLPLRAGGSSRPQSGSVPQAELPPMNDSSSHSSLSLSPPPSRDHADIHINQAPSPRQSPRHSFLGMRSTTPNSFSSRSHFLPTPHLGMRNGEVPKPGLSDLIRAYTLQHAESGLGNDYLKRKNVIRVRMEGEQFLLQAHDVPAVVEWIEGLHAGVNISLDLDERVMPKGPIFPRRRRRRPRRPPGEGARPSRSAV